MLSKNEQNEFEEWPRKHTSMQFSILQTSTLHRTVQNNSVAIVLHRVERFTVHKMTRGAPRHRGARASRRHDAMTPGRRCAVAPACAAPPGRSSAAAPGRRDGRCWGARAPGPGNRQQAGSMRAGRQAAYPGKRRSMQRSEIA